MPSLVVEYEDGETKLDFQHYQQTIVISDVDKTDITSVFSDCEEIRDSDEATINLLSSH